MKVENVEIFSKNKSPIGYVISVNREILIKIIFFKLLFSNHFLKKLGELIVLTNEHVFMTLSEN